jgi:N-acetylglucosaminyldiphosphoundecaprenol N-acetyl-beta-D-mannosaminyltransferase
MTAIDTLSLDETGSDGSHRHHFLGAPFDDFTSAKVVELLRDSDKNARFRYVVTPNVDHVVRLSGNRTLTPYYEQAWMSLCDSKPIAALAHVISLNLPLLPGSDLTVSLFKSVIRTGDLITLIAASDTVVRDLETAYPHVRFRSIVPPAGVWANVEAFQACLDFAAAGDARFVFIAIGSPQSEKIAHALSGRPDAHGIGFCIGASLEFLVGHKKRAPLWMRQAGLEWLHRMASDPKRLWRRYVYAILPLARLFWNEVVGRQHRAG